MRQIRTLAENVAHTITKNIDDIIHTNAAGDDLVYGYELIEHVDNALKEYGYDQELIIHHNIKTSAYKAICGETIIEEYGEYFYFSNRFEHNKELEKTIHAAIVEFIENEEEGM